MYIGCQPSAFSILVVALSSQVFSVNSMIKINYLYFNHVMFPLLRLSAPPFVQHLLRIALGIIIQAKRVR